jgi:hypothetical protein
MATIWTRYVLVDEDPAWADGQAPAGIHLLAQDDETCYWGRPTEDGPVAVADAIAVRYGPVADLVAQHGGRLLPDRYAATVAVELPPGPDGERLLQALAALPDQTELRLPPAETETPEGDDTWDPDQLPDDVSDWACRYWSAHEPETPYAAYQIPWGAMAAILGHRFTGDADDKTTLIQWLRAHGAAPWVRHAREGWEDEHGWGLIGPRLPATDPDTLWTRYTVVDGDIAWEYEPAMVPEGIAMLACGRREIHWGRPTEDGPVAVADAAAVRYGTVAPLVAWYGGRILSNCYAPTVAVELPPGPDGAALWQALTDPTGEA